MPFIYPMITFTPDDLDNAHEAELLREFYGSASLPCVKSIQDMRTSASAQVLATLDTDAPLAS